MDYDEYGQFIDIEKIIIPCPPKSFYINQLEKNALSKIINESKNNRNFTNYESLKKTLFSINTICCVTVTVLFINIWIIPKKS